MADGNHSTVDSLATQRAVDYINYSWYCWISHLWKIYKVYWKNIVDLDCMKIIKLTWTHRTTASLHIHRFHTRQWRATDGGTKGLTLQAVTVCATVNVPTFFIGICFPIKVTYCLLWWCVFCRNNVIILDLEMIFLSRQRNKWSIWTVAFD